MVNISKLQSIQCFKSFQDVTSLSFKIVSMKSERLLLDKFLDTHKLWFSRKSSYVSSKSVDTVLKFFLNHSWIFEKGEITFSSESAYDFRTFQP